VGAEALARWQHPARGLVMPGEFVPVAEATGQITPLTTYVLRTAIRQVAAWREDGLEVTVAVNLSARSLLHARDRRLRHRPLVARLPRAAAGARDQDRQVVRARHGRRLLRRDDRATSHARSPATTWRRGLRSARAARCRPRSSPA